MIISIIALTLGYGIKFTIKGKKQFFQLNFDWKREKNIQDLGEVFIDSLSYNYISINSLNQHPNPEFTYKLHKNNDIFYFRYVYVIQQDSKYNFHGVEWITDVPKQKNTSYHLKEIHLPLKNAGPSVITIGDEFVFENEGKYLRKDILGRYTVHFLGNHTDVFNLKYYDGKNINSKDIVSNINDLESAEFYVVFLGKNETDVTKYQEKVCLIQEKLSLKNPKGIIWIMLPPAPNDSQEIHFKELNNTISKFKEYSKTDVINTPELFADSISRFVREDGLSISRDGYFRIAKQTAKMIKDAN